MQARKDLAAARARHGMEVDVDDVDQAPLEEPPLGDPLVEAALLDETPADEVPVERLEDEVSVEAPVTTDERRNEPVPEDLSRRERAAAEAAARAAAEDDRIVEAPRAPKVPGRQRRRVFAVLSGVIGAIGLICSLILAFGALLVALGADHGSVYDLVSGISDGLIGPLRDVFSFSGTNAETKEALVAWGAGAIIYLLIGMIAQSMLRSAAQD